MELPKHIEVCALQPPGREGRYSEPPFTDVCALSESLCDGIAPFLDRPFAIFGHSLGAVVAYEATLSLARRSGLSPVVLLVSSHRAPGLPPIRRPIHALPEPEFLDELRRLSGTPPDLFNELELLEVVVPVLRADFRMAETYVPTSHNMVVCPIVALGSTDDPHVNPATMVPWRARTTGGFELVMLPGDHFYLNTHRSLVLGIIVSRLAYFLR